MPSKTILLYTPNLTGHPQVYCRVIGDIILKHGAQLIIATGSNENWVVRWPDLRPFAVRPDVQVVPTSKFSKNSEAHLRATELRNLQKNYQIDATLFVIPEFFRNEFIKIGSNQAKPLMGRNVGIFGGTTKWYPGEEFYGGRRIRPFEGTLRQNLGKIKRRIFRPHTIDKYFFERMLIGRNVLDAIIVKDERILEKYGPPVWWLPEIYKVFNATDDSEGKEEWKRLRPAFKKFSAQYHQNDLLLFFGFGTWHKGYDYFIQLLSRDSSAIGVHAGSGIRHVPGKTFIGNPELEREKLLQQGRLFETGGYVKSQRFIDYVFSCSRRFVSTHRLTVSSGTMLQALDKGLPVLVPDSGLLGYRVNKFGLGQTYRYGDIDDLVDKWLAFKNEPVKKYQNAIKRFMSRFERSAVEELFVKVLLEE